MILMVGCYSLVYITCLTCSINPMSISTIGGVRLFFWLAFVDNKLISTKQIATFQQIYTTKN